MSLTLIFSGAEILSQEVAILCEAGVIFSRYEAVIVFPSRVAKQALPTVEVSLVMSVADFLHLDCRGVSSNKSGDVLMMSSRVIDVILIGKFIEIFQMPLVLLEKLIALQPMFE